MIYHNKKRVYLGTSHFVVDGQLKKDYTIKDKDLLALLTSELGDYRKRISEFGNTINHLSAIELGKLGGQSVEKIARTKFSIVTTNANTKSLVKPSLNNGLTQMNLEFFSFLLN
ncbi:hypothetical protein ACUN24_09440 [Pedobacter sp. WC2501]|uniref:hypothetical protein n=1 Tax=Pedobacter sp. WC2501 TaxID=3461400 RepID=UPI004045E983